ncbi:unnamed protein product, partial [Scytosiphon promiscuus]
HKERARPCLTSVEHTARRASLNQCYVHSQPPFVWFSLAGSTRRSWTGSRGQQRQREASQRAGVYRQRFARSRRLNILSTADENSAFGAMMSPFRSPSLRSDTSDQGRKSGEVMCSRHPRSWVEKKVFFITKTRTCPYCELESYAVPRPGPKGELEVPCEPGFGGTAIPERRPSSRRGTPRSRAGRGAGGGASTPRQGRGVSTPRSGGGG